MWSAFFTLAKMTLWRSCNPVRILMKTTLCDATLLSFQGFARIKLRVAHAARKNCTSFFADWASKANTLNLMKKGRLTTLGSALYGKRLYFFCEKLTLMHYWVGNAKKSWVSHQNVKIYLARPESMSFEAEFDIEKTSKMCVERRLSLTLKLTRL